MARHLVAAGRLIEEEPAEALAHAMAARRLAARIGAVREAVGIAAYHAGEWQTAIAELRTYQRITGRASHLAVVADCERALGRPERAIDLHRTADRAQLAPAEAMELLIVAAGARRDLGQPELAVAMLQVPELSAADDSGSWVPRLRYAYADALIDAGRPVEAREWFARAAVADQESSTDAAERLLELDGVVLDETPELAEPEPEAAELAEPELAEPEPEQQETAPVEEAAMVEAGPGRLVDAYDLVVLDLDGVVYLGDQPVPAAIEAIAQLRAEAVPIVYATNNASRSPADVADLLNKLGAAAEPVDVLTSAAVAAEALADRLPPGAAVLVVGADALAEEVRRVGLHPVHTAEEQPSAVVQGYGPKVGWAELAEACLAIRGGAAWVVTNTDATLPSPRGLLPGNGSLVAALRTALERDPDLVVGKPQAAFFQAAARRTGAGTPLIVGDRLDTDIEGANRAGMDSLLVFTGVDGAAQARAAAPDRRPAYVGADLTALFAPATAAYAA